MTEKTTIEVENVGGLAGKHTFTLVKGLNEVGAGNAVGKTSFQKAIELLALKNPDLKGAKHYANMFSDGVVTVKASGGVNCDRRFRVTGDDLHDAGGEPLIDAGNGYVSSICFAIPENPLMNKMLEGQSIKSYMKTFSDSEHYDTAIEVLGDIHSRKISKLSTYRETLARIDETKDTIELHKKDKETVEEKIKALPKMDITKITKDFKTFQKLDEQKQIKSDELADSKVELNDTEENIDDIVKKIKYLDEEKKDIESKYPKLDKKLDDINMRKPEVEISINNVERDISKTEDELDMAQKNKVSRVRFKGDENGICHACGKKLSDKELGVFITKLEGKLDDCRKVEKKLSRELEDLEDEETELRTKQSRAGIIKDEILANNMLLAKYESNKTKLEKDIEQLGKEIQNLEKEIEKIAESGDAFKKYQEKANFEAQLSEKRKSLQQAENRLKDLKSGVVDVEKLQKELDFLDEAIKHMNIRHDEIVDAVRVRFNKTINGIYNSMGFKDVEDIRITPDYTITVTKKKGGVEVEDFPLNALSASERVTLGVSLLMVAKQEYIPTFPFFVIDEIVTSYDPKRFEKIKEYIKDVTDYVIVTKLTDKDGIVIQHEG